MTELLEITLQETLSNTQCINRWNYLADGVPATLTFSFALTKAMGFIESAGSWPDTGILCKLLTFQNVSVHAEQVICKNIYDLTDFYATPLSPQPVGAINASPLNPLDAFGFRTNQTTRAVRRGTKRFTGVSTNQVITGGNYVSATTTELQALADAMTAILTLVDEGNTLTFTPCVVSKEKYTTPSGKIAYRYFASKATQLQHIAQSVTWEPYPTTRSQTSRQYGRGQ